MARTDDDTWDPATGVGMTATFGAVARAVATNKGLINDPFAERLVRAAGVHYFTQMVENGRYSDDGADKSITTALLTMLWAHTRFLDDYLADAGRAGIRQVVILGVGSGHPAVSAVVAAGHDGVRDRSAGRHRLQVRRAARAGRRADREPVARSGPTFGTTGWPRCGGWASTPRNPPCGLRRICWSGTCRRTGRIGCYTTSPRQCAAAAGSPPITSPPGTHCCWRPVAGVRRPAGGNSGWTSIWRN